MMNRAEFLQWAAAFVGAGTAGSVNAGAATLPSRRLGRTGVTLPMLGLGGYHLGQSGSEAAARTLVDAAFDEGIRFFDTAESYQNGTSEQWLGAALAGRRDQVFVMSKSFDFPRRRPEMAERHLAGTLKRLRTDKLDLWQLHSVRTVADVDLAFAPGGAFEMMLELKAKGAARFLGVTGHQQPEANLRAIHYWDQGLKFDVMQMPLNPIDYHQQSFQRYVLPELVRRDIGVIAMKTSADGALLREKICSIDECLRYAWSLPISLAVVGMLSPVQVRENAARARSFSAYSDAERRALLSRIAPRAALSLEWYKSGPSDGRGG
ncbi:MAG: aldo/keto reductase [Gemmatimonadota bacterium]